MDKPKKRRALLWFAVLPPLLVLIVIKFFVVDLFTIPQDGMYPTLPAGSRFLCRRHPYSNPAQVNRGDIVVFKQAYQGGTYDLIWRVVALPGDRVESSHGALVINGTPLNRQFVRADASATIYRETNGAASYEIAVQAQPAKPPPSVSVTVPPGQFFLMGDNRDIALDSRLLGPVRFEAIKARKL